MSKAYEEFNRKRESLLLEVHNLNDEINQNRQATAAKVKAWEAAVVAGDNTQADKLRAEADELERSYGWLTRKVEVLSRAGTKNSPVLKELAKKVYEDNRAEMETIKVEWEKLAKVINEAYATILSTVKELGTLAKAGDRLKNQCADVREVTGLNFTYIQSPADVQVNIDKKTGLIFPDHKAILQAYK